MAWVSRSELTYPALHALTTVFVVGERVMRQSSESSNRRGLALDPPLPDQTPRSAGWPPTRQPPVGCQRARSARPYHPKEHVYWS